MYCHTFTENIHFSGLQLAIAPMRLFPATDAATPLLPRHTSTSPPTPTHTASGGIDEVKQHNRQCRSDSSPTRHCFSNPPLHIPDATSLPLRCTTATATSGGVTTSTACAAACSTLLDAMEGACHGVLSLRCRVLRVYRRAVYTTGTITS